MRAGKPIELRSNVGEKLSPIFVDDAANALESCLSLSDSHLLNLAGSEVVTIKEIANYIGEYLSVKPKYVNREGSVDVFVADISKMISLLSVPTVKLSSGINSLIGTDRN